MIACNFAALWPREPTVSLWKDDPIVDIVSAQETSSILKIGSALSIWPYFHSVYLVGVFSYRFFQDCNSVLPKRSNFKIWEILFYSTLHLWKSLHAKDQVHTIPFCRLIPFPLNEIDINYFDKHSTQFSIKKDPILNENAIPLEFLWRCCRSALFPCINAKTESLAF